MSVAVPLPVWEVSVAVALPGWEVAVRSVERVRPSAPVPAAYVTASEKVTVTSTVSPIFLVPSAVVPVAPMTETVGAV